MRRVYDYKIPIISAVGHETDFTLLDFGRSESCNTNSSCRTCRSGTKKSKRKSNYLFNNLIQKIKFFINDHIKELKTINSVLALNNFKR